MRLLLLLQGTAMSTPTISAIPNIRSRTALSGTRARTQIVVPELRIADGPSATVLQIARSRGPLSRDTAAKASGLSIATVNRQVTSLLDPGILRERADLTASGARSEEHTSELQSLMRISYAVFCLKKNI